MTVYGRSRNPGKIDPGVVSGLSVYNWTNEVNADSPLLAWTLQEASGSTLADVSGNGRNGTLSGSYSRASSGPNGLASVAFTGGYGSIAYASWMNSASFTVEMFFMTSDLSAVAGLAARDGGGSNRPWTVQMKVNGAIDAFGNNQTGPVKTTIATGLDDGNWHYFAWGCDSGGGGFHIVDGSVDNTYSGGGTIVQPASIGIFLGRNDVAGLSNWSGSLAFFACYNTKISTSRLLAHRSAVLA